ncbi:hypothetical protein NMNM174_1972 [Neisseria meningitidis NM174]|nr:hypothetical protein NMNM174_1972 [Neisseria meningitidis NM174]
MQVSVWMDSSFPRRRESRSVGAETYRVKRFLEIFASWIPTFVGMTGCRFVGMTWCRFPYGWIRHSRAGGNLGLSVRKLIG